MKKIYIIVGLLLFASVAFPQVNSKQHIISSGNYYYGEAVAFDEREAEDRAMDKLLQGISVTVTSQFQTKVEETETNLKQSVQSIVNSYAGATLKNVQSIVTPRDDGQVEVFRYISKSEVEEIFKERRVLISDLFNRASESEEVGNITNALKLYYFCSILINSLPDQSLRVRGQNLITEIPQRINSIINGISFTVLSDNRSSQEERILSISINYKGKPTQSVDYQYWDGVGMVSQGALDGRGVISLFGSSMNFNKLDVKIKYAYYESKDEIKEVGMLWGIVKKTEYKNSKQLDLKIGTPVAETPPAPPVQTPPLTEGTGEQEIKNAGAAVIAKTETKAGIILNLANPEGCPESILSSLTNNALTMLGFIKAGNLNGIGELLGGDVYLKNKVSQILKFNKPRITDTEISASVNKTSMGWELRKIRVNNSYTSLKKKSIEYLIFDFDDKGAFYDVNFGIMEGLYEGFVEQGLMGKDWGNRQEIIKFVERYRTAFLGRDINLLDSLFAEDAIIITGRVVKRKKLEDVQYIQLNDAQPTAKYLKQTKEEYLKRQKQVFANQKDIFISYSDFKMMRKNTDSRSYGVSMRQSYNATTYADDGYLFLLIDFDKAQPQIYIRSWQPSEWSDEALVRMSNFNLNK